METASSIWDKYSVICNNAAATGFASENAEKCVIACFMLSEEAVKHIDEITVEDFSQDSYKKLYTVIRELHAQGKPVDLITVDDVLMAKYTNEEKQLFGVCLDCSKELPTWRNYEAYIQIVTGLSQRRRALAAVGEIYRDLQNSENDTNVVVERGRQSLRDLANTSHKWSTMPEVLLDTYMELDRRASGENTAITTGLSNVDMAIGGLFGGELTYVGARPSVGKSAFGANIAIHAAMRGYKVAICSREMTGVQFGQRILSYGANVDGMKLRKAQIGDDDWSALMEAMATYSELPISFLFTVRTVEDLRAEVQIKADKGEIDMLIVDYLQLMHTKQRFKEDHLRVAYISKCLKDMATEFKIPIIVLAQVKRFAGGGRAKMPTLEDFKDSGAIEQDADGVIFLHRPEDAEDPYVDPRDKQYFEFYKERGYQYIAFGIAKQRQGATGKACALFDPAYMRYTVIDRTNEGGGDNG